MAPITSIISSRPHSRSKASTSRPKVDHAYRELSLYLEEGGEIIKHKKFGRNFPAKLHRMLSEHKFSHIIAWMPHGRAFKIRNKDLLTSTAVPEYFVQTKFESFTRQLSGWGFKRLYRPGADHGCYYHECFLRGLPGLTSMMTRVSSKQGKLAPFPEGEPDFYLISRLHPVPLTFVPEDSQAEVAALVVLLSTGSIPHDNSASNESNEPVASDIFAVASDDTNKPAVIADSSEICAVASINGMKPWSGVVRDSTTSSSASTSATKAVSTLLPYKHLTASTYQPPHQQSADLQNSAPSYSGQNDWALSPYHTTGYALPPALTTNITPPREIEYSIQGRLEPTLSRHRESGLEQQMMLYCNHAQQSHQGECDDSFSEDMNNFLDNFPF